jgi:predicted deacylase
MFKVIVALLLWWLGQNAAAGLDFLSNYEDSRSRFRAYCLNEPQAVFCRQFRIPSQIDSDLSMDIGYFGGSGRRLIVLQSGIHGPETPAGAAIQQLFIEKYLRRFLNMEVDVLLVHAVNPYGFKFGRRVDESNIDLNRNFTLNPNLYHIENADYLRMRSILEPPGRVAGLGLAYARIELGLVLKYAMSGFDRRRANAAITGQYRFPRGLNYGGSGPTEQVRIFSDLYRGLFSRYEQILILDIHTGLGEKGVLNIIPSENSNTESLKGLVDRFSRLKSEGVKTVDLAADKKFYGPNGDVIDFVPQLAPKTACTIALTMEYGTLGSNLLNELDTVSRLVLENQAHFNGCLSDSICAQVKRAFAELFNPSDEGWRNAVLSRADRVFEAFADRHL